MLFGCETEDGKVVCDVISSVQCEEFLKLKEARLDAFIAQKPKRTGGMCGAHDTGEHFVMSMDPAHPEALAQADGAEPWMLKVKRGACKWGPGDSPLPGVGCFVQAKSQNCHAAIINVDTVLRQGVTLADFMQYLDTPSGAKFVKSDEVKVVSIPAGSVLWSPFGHVAVLFAYGKEDLATATFWAVPYWLGAWVTAAPQQAMAAIKEWNSVHLKKKATDPVWKDRAQWFASSAVNAPAEEAK